MFIVASQATIPTKPTERSFNGLITNDKFCMIRSVQLRLRQPPNYRLRLQATQGSKSQYPPDEKSHCGGKHETSMVYSPGVQSLSGRATTLGPGVSIPPAVDRERVGSNRESTTGGRR